MLRVAKGVTKSIMDKETNRITARVVSCLNSLIGKIVNGLNKRRIYAVTKGAFACWKLRLFQNTAKFELTMIH